MILNNRIIVENQQYIGSIANCSFCRYIVCCSKTNISIQINQSHFFINYSVIAIYFLFSVIINNVHNNI